MIEAGAKEVSDDDMYEAIMQAHEVNRKTVEFINSIVAEIGKPKFEYPSCDVDHDLFEQIREYATDAVKALSDAQILKGSDGYFRPKADITRAEAVTLLLRIYNLK